MSALNDNFSVLCFSWNAGGLKICERLSQVAIEEERRGFKNFFLRKGKCLTADFFADISREISAYKPSLVVIATQGEPSSDTRFHSDLLTPVMESIYYYPYERKKLDKIGEKKEDYIISGRDIVETSAPAVTSLRTSIFIRSDLYRNYLDYNKTRSRELSQKCSIRERISGALYTGIGVPGIGTIGIVNIHFPGDLDNVLLNPYERVRRGYKSSQEDCFAAIYDRFYTNQRGPLKPSHLIIIGSVNYNIDAPAEEIKMAIQNGDYKKIRDKDELTKEKSIAGSPFFSFKEGVNESGPDFPPTWRMYRGRDKELCSSKNKKPECYDSRTLDPRTIGWHDRILWKSFSERLPGLKCLMYDSIVSDTIAKSNNDGVAALLSIEKIKGARIDRTFEASAPPESPISKKNKKNRK